MKNCLDTKSRLPLLAAGEIAEPDVTVMHEHLALCETCRAAYDELRRLVGELDARPALTEVEHLRLENSVLRKYSLDAGRPSWRITLPRAGRVVLRLAAGILLFAAGYATQETMREPRVDHSGSAPAWSVRDLRDRTWVGQRLSGPGLHVIARGRTALPEKADPGI